MKILVIQLARLGDILQTRPVISGLRRKYPEAEIHLLVRSLFAGATFGIEDVTVLEFETKEFLGDASEGFRQISSFVDDLQGYQYDKIINLSYSPVSSYLTSLVATKTSEVVGYSRHLDGFFFPKDDYAAYFYAQVGINRPNRAHIIDIFAAASGIELQLQDYQMGLPSRQQPQNRIVLHMGASQETKRYHPYRWRAAVKAIREFYSGEIVLVGSENERELASLFFEGAEIENVVDKIGKTDLKELAQIIAHSEFVMGGDSMVCQMASLTQTPTLQLSFGSVNFWETGPKAKGSRVLFCESPNNLPPHAIADLIATMSGFRTTRVPHLELFHVVPTQEVPETYFWKNYQSPCPQWEMVKSVYFGQLFSPMLHQSARQYRLGLQQLTELGRDFMANLNSLSRVKDRKQMVEILNSQEAIINILGQSHPVLQPLIGWYVTEKIRQGPGDIETVVGYYIAITQKLVDFSESLMNFLNLDSASEVVDGNKNVEL